MNETIIKLTQYADSIRDLEIKRIEIKSKLFSDLVEKEFNLNVQAGRVLLAETEVYINDIEKKYTNDKARKAAVETILTDDEICHATLNRITGLESMINNYELSLKALQIEINYLEKLYAINMITIQTGV